MPSSATPNNGGRRVLVVATAPVRARALRAHLASLGVAEGGEVKVVSPASRLSRLQWLANEEDDARAEAEDVAAQTAAAVGDDVSVDAGVGDVDPIQATEDALAQFPAEELVVLVPTEDDRSQLERAALAEGFERFGLPVRYVVAGEPRDEG